MPTPPVPFSSSPADSGNVASNIPLPNLIAPPRADFDESRYEQLIAQHGVDCLYEKALQCPCKTEQINALSTCKNCGGTGWVFVNGRQVRMVVQGMSYKRIEDVWSAMMSGLVIVSYMPDIELAYYDRITRLNAKSIFSEVIDFEIPASAGTSDAFGFTSYIPKEIEYIGLYQSDILPFLPLTTDQYTVTNNRINIKNIDLPIFDKLTNPLTATIRYSHAPTFNVLEVSRESFEKFKWDGKGEILQELPNKALARKTHQIDDLVKLRNGKLNNNSYKDDCCCK